MWFGEENGEDIVMADETMEAMGFLRLRQLLFLLLLYEYLNRIRLFLQLQAHLLNLASVPNLVLQMHKAQSSL